MARNIAPETPTTIGTPTVKVPDIDLSVFDKLGDAKIKSATQNFQLYATTTLNAESQKLFNQYSANPVALANALSKLPEMFSDLPQSVQDEMKQKLATNAISLVRKAQANQEKAINKDNLLRAHAGANLLDQQLQDDVFNVLSDMVAPEDEKKGVIKDIYMANRANLQNLVTMVNSDGTPLFSETERAKMIMPKQAILNGTIQFVNRMELDQLKNWDNDVFQNRNKFKEDLGIDDDTYDSIETYVKKRLQALADTKTRTIHGQAYYDQMNLVNEPTQLNIEKAKAYPFTDDKAIDKLVEASKETTLAKYYDPMRPTGINGFVQAYNVFGDKLKGIPDNMAPQQQAEIIASLGEVMKQLYLVSEASNLEPEYASKIKQALFKAYTDKASRQALVDADFANRTIYQTISEAAKESFDGSLVNAPKKYQTKLKKESEANVYKTAAEEALENATRIYNEQLGDIIDIYIAGDLDTFKKACAEADRIFDKNRASVLVKSQAEWARLESALANKQPALLEYNGRTLQFNGFDNRGAIFVEKN